jgi:predicted nuclease of predicted toxin-antitoxin system
MIFRFVCDHDVDVAVAMMLRKAGHEAWTAADAGLYRAGDDDLTVYADNKDAVLISHDTEFSQRRRNVIGKHIWLRCSEWDAADLLCQYLPELLPLLWINRDLWIRISADGSRVLRKPQALDG